MEERVIQLETTVAQMTTFINSLFNSGTIPLDFQKALEGRLGGFRTSSSSKAASTETQAVSEGGSDSYNVSKPPDGFREMIIEGGTTIYIPYFN